jgi:hypothetical protein
VSDSRWGLEDDGKDLDEEHQLVARKVKVSSFHLQDVKIQDLFFRRSVWSWLNP